MEQARHFEGAYTSPRMDNEPLQDFLKLLSDEVCRNLSDWMKFLKTPAASSVAHQRLQLSGVIERVSGERDALNVLKTTALSTYSWARYLTSRTLRTYFDVTEQLGVRMKDDATRDYECGEEVWPLIGQLLDIDIKIVMAKYSVGERWSFFGTSPPRYLSGPVSLINHACRKHSNVTIKPIDRYPSWFPTRSDFVRERCVVAVAETRIYAGDRIYATYDDNTSGLQRTRGIVCIYCRN